MINALMSNFVSELHKPETWILFNPFKLLFSVVTLSALEQRLEWPRPLVLLLAASCSLWRKCPHFGTRNCHGRSSSVLWSQRSPQISSILHSVPSDIKETLACLKQTNIFCSRCVLVNSLWPSDAIWRHRSGSTLVQIMVCCLTAPSHYLNQCWLIISEVLWHSPEGNFTWNAQDMYPWREFENCLFKITSTSPRGQSVNALCIELQNIAGKLGQYHACWCPAD